MVVMVDIQALAKVCRGLRGHRSCMRGCLSPMVLNRLLDQKTVFILLEIVILLLIILEQVLSCRGIIHDK